MDAAFSLAETGLRSSPDGYEITVTFRWTGQDGVLGFASPVEQDDDWPATPEEAGAAVCIYLEENLMAGGYGLENAAGSPGCTGRRPRSPRRSDRAGQGGPGDAGQGRLRGDAGQGRLRGRPRNPESRQARRDPRAW